MSESQLKSNSFERRLAGYAVAAGAAVLSVGQADAGVISSGPLSINVPLGPIGALTPANIYQPDFNNDSFFDFVLFNFTDEDPTAIPPVVPATALTSIAGGSAGTVVFAPGVVTPLSLGALIDGSQINAKVGKMTFDAIPPTMASPTPWQPGFDAYIGIAFLSGPDTLFGWVEAMVEVDYSITVEGWAYNTVPGQGLLAGTNTAVVPEPSSLALLAAGAAGVVAFRARKRRAVTSAS